MKVVIEVSFFRFWLILNNKNYMYCEYVIKKKKICVKNICCYISIVFIVLIYLRVLIKMYFVLFCSLKVIIDFF